jgi:hypothetical protein
MPSVVKIALTFLLSAAVAHTYAQGSSTLTATARATAQRVAPKGPPPIKNEISFGYRLATDGWGIYTDYGMVRSKNAKLADMFNEVHILQLEIAEKKHPQQEKLTVQDVSGNVLGKYVYGKINNFYSIKAGYGYRKLLAGKPDPGSVSIHWTNLIGGCLGMIKPYYLEVQTDPTAIRYSDDTRPDFLNQNNIVRGAGFSKGFGELKMIPGGQLKSMLHFDFAPTRNTVSAIETGISVEYYAEPIPLMYDKTASAYFLNAFVSFQFGKRW